MNASTPNWSPALLAASLAAGAIAIPAKADVALEWTFDSLNWGNFPAVPSTTANIVNGLFPEYNPGHINAAASLVHIPSTGTANVLGRTGNGSKFSLSSDHWNMNDYFEFDVAANAYSSFSFSMTGGVGSPSYFQIMALNDGYWNFVGGIFPTGAAWNTFVPNTASSFWFDLSKFHDLSAIKIIDPTNAGTAPSRFPYPNEIAIDDVTFSVAPEPASAAAIAPAAFLLARRRRK